MRLRSKWHLLLRFTKNKSKFSKARINFDSRFFLLEARTARPQVHKKGKQSRTNTQKLTLIMALPFFMIRANGRTSRPRSDYFRNPKNFLICKKTPDLSASVISDGSLIWLSAARRRSMISPKLSTNSGFFSIIGFKQ